MTKTIHGYREYGYTFCLCGERVTDNCSGPCSEERGWCWHCRIADTGYRLEKAEERRYFSAIDS